MTIVVINLYEISLDIRNKNWFDILLLLHTLKWNLIINSLSEIDLMINDNNHNNGNNIFCCQTVSDSHGLKPPKTSGKIWGNTLCTNGKFNKFVSWIALNIDWRKN